MQVHRIALIRTSIADLKPVTGQAAACFYERLFILDPTLRSLFPDDMEAQGRKLMQTLAFVAAHIDRLDVLLPAVTALGQRHRTYGVRDAHYETVREALLWMFAHLLGPGFTPELRAAWQEAYTVLAHVMQAASREADPAVPEA